MFFWYHLKQDVERYEFSCADCNRNKITRRYGRVPVTNYQAGAPMEMVHIDFLGPLPRTADGNEHCLVMVDQFTKWVECVPLPSQKEKVTAKAAIDIFFLDLGILFNYFQTRVEISKAKYLIQFVSCFRLTKLGQHITVHLLMVSVSVSTEH